MRLIFFALIGLIIVLCWYFFMPQDYFDTADNSVIEEETQSIATESKTPAQVKDTEQVDPERQAKEEAFAQLEKARRNLDRRLARLKALLWNKKLPKDEAERINQQLLNAYGLLRNKKLLGAYGSLTAIKDELNQVNYAYDKVVEITQQIKSMSSTE